MGIHNNFNLMEANHSDVLESIGALQYWGFTPSLHWNELDFNDFDADW